MTSKGIQYKINELVICLATEKKYFVNIWSDFSMKFCSKFGKKIKIKNIENKIKTQAKRLTIFI